MSKYTWKLPDLRDRADLPKLGETQLQVQQCYAREGDCVVVNQPLVTLETEDKDISLTIDSPVAGIIRSLPLVTGQIVRTGDVLAIFELKAGSDTNK